MSELTWSDLVWAGWLLLFLGLELSAVFNLAPWVTLSETSWLNEKAYPILRTILFGFLIGLAVHIRYSTGLWKSSLGGVLVAVVLNFLW